MTIRILCTLTILLAGWIALASKASSAPAQEQYKMDAVHSGLVFRITHLGMSYTFGRFNDVQGSFSLDRSNPAGSSFQFTAKAASVDTNNAKRDQHLRGPDFFNAKQFPKITFKSTKVKATDKGYELTGNITLHGKTRPITIQLEKVGEGKDPWGHYRVGFVTSFKIKRTEFGMDRMLDVVGDVVELSMSFEGVRS